METFDAVAAQSGDLYVPSFKVEVGGKDAVRELFLTVKNVVVDLKLRAASRFSFVVANAFDWETRAFLAKKDDERIRLDELFKFGSPVQCFFGYTNPSEGKFQLKRLMSGIITELTTNFTEGSTPDLTISGYDKLFLLTTGKSHRNWDRVLDSKAVQDVIGGIGLRTEIQATKPTKERIEQFQESEFRFIDRLAKRNQAIFYIRDGTFVFGKPKNSEAAVIEIPWGRGLLSFNPTANLAQPVERVEVFAQPATKGEVITGVATTQDATGAEANRVPGGDVVAQALNNEPRLRIRAAVHTQAEADARAKAVLEERAQQTVKGSGKSIGLPAIVPDVNIALTGLGPTFSKTYYVNAATHTIDSSGYHTSFEVQEPNLVGKKSAP